MEKLTYGVGVFHPRSVRLRPRARVEILSEAVGHRLGGVRDAPPGEERGPCVNTLSKEVGLVCSKVLEGRKVLVLD